MNPNQGRLNIVGIGPGNDEHITPAALHAIKEAQYVVGYSTYIGLVRHHLGGKQVTRTGMTEEIGRARNAVETAEAGHIVTLISSGDSGVYGMAGLVFEVLRERGWKRGQAPEVRLIPGITAANSCASLVGAPLIHDTCRISLSDLLTPWPVIEKRIESAAQGDFVICLYNPASGRRQRQIVEAAHIIKQHRPGSTPVALVKSAYRRQQSVVISDLDHFLDFEIGMNTTVLIGSTNTFVFEGYMVTPRGHTNKYRLEDGSVLEGQRKARSLVCEGDMASKSGEQPKLNITKIEGAFVRASTELYEVEEEDSSVGSALEALAILQRQSTVSDKEVLSEPLATKTSAAPASQDLGLIARMAGGIVFKTGTQYYLIGDLKEPCNFQEFGFQDPKISLNDKKEIHPLQIHSQDRVDRMPWIMAVNMHGEAGAMEVYRRFVIYRNSSTSERLTNLVRDTSGTITVDGKELIDARWLSQTPPEVWEIVREQILKCS